MKKRLIALMCAGVIGLSMAGCSSIQENIEDLANNPLNENSQDIIYADKYIVLDENGCSTLHKGDVYLGYGAGLVEGCKVHKFDCGEEIYCTYPYRVSDTIPKETAYDEVCEDCFNLNN